MLWSSIPCVGGCRYNVDINSKKSPEAYEKFQEQRRIYRELWATFSDSARAVRRSGGKICIEWPKSCQYWKQPEVVQFIRDYGLKIAEVHGCSLGLTDSKGQPINKPRLVATDDDTIFDALNKYRCKGCKAHALCCNKDCKETEGYTDDMAKLIHKAWRQSVITVNTSTAGKKGIIPNPTSSSEVSEKIPAMPLRARKYTNRDTHGHGCTQHMAVARPVPKAEVRNSPVATAKCKEEFDKLVVNKAWDMRRPREKADVIAEARKLGFKAHSGRLFMLCVEKGSELPYGHKDRKYKGRFVFQGNNVQDELRDWAIFNELGANTAPIEGAKIIYMFGLQPSHITQTADADQAYVQAFIKDYTLERDPDANGKRQRVSCQTWVTLLEEYVPEE